MDDYEYFKSEADKYCFILIETDAKVRCDLLGVRRIHYCSKKKAKHWFMSIAKKIHPDRNPDHPKCNEAMAKLNELYRRMTY